MERNTTEHIDTLRERIENSEKLAPADREALIEFSDELRFRASDYSNHRHLKLLRHCTILAGDSERYDPDELPDHRLVDALDDEEVAKDFVRWIHRTFDSEETNRDYRVAIRRLAAHLSSGDPDDTRNLPDSISQISATTSNNYEPMPDPNDMYRWEEHIIPMIDACNLLRDKALITMAWDSGARSGEIRELTVGDVGDHAHGMSVTFDGKTGQRSVVLIPSVPHVRQWLSNHPRRDDPDAPLWCNTNNGEDISYQMKLKILRSAARKADINPPSKATFTRMRKSSASYLAAQNVSQVHLENHHGWKRGSDIAARYIAVFSEETDREIARAHGADVSVEETDPTAPLECPRCGLDTPRNEPVCVHCGQALDPEAAEQVREQDDRLFDSALQAEGETANDIEWLRDRVQANPELRAFLLGEQ